MFFLHSARYSYSYQWQTRGVALLIAIFVWQTGVSNPAGSKEFYFVFVRFVSIIKPARGYINKTTILNKINVAINKAISLVSR